MTIQILEIKEEDLEKIVELEKELYISPWKVSDYLYEIKKNPFAHYLKMIIKETNEIVGYIGFWITFETAQITKVSIAKKYQGYKLSKLLMAIRLILKEK